MSQPFKRSRLWIDPPFQARLLLRMVGYFLLYIFLVWHISFFFEVVRHVASSGTYQLTFQLYLDYFWKQQPLVWAMVLVVPTLLYDLLKFSHRVAGPLYRCRNVMRDMAAGKKVPQFQPRRHDLMVELFAAFNLLIQACNERTVSDHPVPDETTRPVAPSLRSEELITVNAPQQ
jgi:hypothetical protein